MNLTSIIKNLVLPVAAFLLFDAMGTASGYEGILLKGRVTGSDGTPVQYATVALTDAGGTVIAGAVSGEDGTYQIKAYGVSSGDDLIFLCSFIGYEDFRSRFADMIACHDTDPDSGQDVLLLGDAVMHEDAQALAGAVVSGKRELIEHHFDKLVLNVSGLAVAQTGNALDVLKSSPGVTVDKDGNVKLNGQTVSVWIDGRPSSMSGKDLEVYLKGSSGTAIEKVELMSSPSAKYDAEGSGGIINIKTRKGFMRGLSGSVTANGGMRIYEYNGTVLPYCDFSANLMYKTDKNLTSFSYSPYYGTSTGFIIEDKWYGEDWSSMQHSESGLDNRWTGHHLRLQNDWNITQKDVLGVMADFSTGYNGRHTSGNGSLISDYRAWGTPGQELYSVMRSGSSEAEKRRFIYANLNYTHTFDESRSAELTLNADYSRNMSGISTWQKNIWEIRPSLTGDDTVFTDYGFEENTARILDLVSLKADYSTVFWKSTGRIEAGLKGAVSLTGNKFSRFSHEPSTWQPEAVPSSTNDFKYREQVYAGYLNVAKQFSPEWNAQAGIRGEMTVTKGIWQDTADTSDSYFDIFPNVTVSWIPSQKFIFSANWSYRISRPKYWQLNPFISYINATTYTQGNPGLRPSYSHNVSLSAVLFGRLSITPGYGKVRNYNEWQVPYFDMENGKMGHLYKNAGTVDMAYVSLSLSEQKMTGWWTVTFSGTWSYNLFKAYSGVSSGFGEGYVNKGHSFYGYASTTFYLPHNFKTGLSGFYCTPQTAGFYDVAGMGSLNFDFSKTFLDGKLALSLHVEDILGTLDTDLTIYDGDVLSYRFDQNFSNRSVKIGLTWRFGQTVNSRRKVGDLDESSRM